MPGKPTGSRPTPKVAKAKGHSAAKGVKVRPAAKHTPMGAPKAKSTMKDTSKRRGF